MQCCSASYGSTCLFPSLPVPPQGSVSILAHSLGSVLCYDVLCGQPQAAPALAGTGTPASPHQLFRQQQAVQQQQQRQQEEGAQQELGTPRGSEGGDAMVIDLTIDSPTAALQQELSRLRAENQRLQLQLEVTRAEGGSGGGSGSWAQQQQQRQLVTGSAPAVCLLPPASSSAASQQGQSVGGGAAAVDGTSAAWPPLQFTWVAAAPV